MNSYALIQAALFKIYASSKQKVSKSLKQPLITTGNFVDDFEKKLRKFFKVDNAFM